jgi:hypothetical protein
MYLVVAGAAEAHEVLPLMCPALGYGQNMVYLIYRGEPSFLDTQLAQRIIADISVADLLPRSAVGFVHLGGAVVFIIKVSLPFCVFGAVLLALCKPTAFGVITRSFWFVWHEFTS